MNFVVCPYDNTRLKAFRVAADPARPPFMTCPTCRKQFKLAGGEAVEVAPDGNEPGT